MTDKIKLPALPALPWLGYDPESGNMHGLNHDDLRARDIEVARCVLEAAAKMCDAVAADATSEKRMKFLTAQGKAIYEGMYGGAINYAGGIRALEVTHD